MVMIVADHGSDAKIGIPIRVGRILVPDADLPLAHRQTFLHMAARRVLRGNATGTAVNEGTRVCRIQEDQANSPDARAAPNQFAAGLPAGDQQVLLVAKGHDPAEGFYLEEGREEQINPALDLGVGVLRDPSQLIADKADRQRQG